MEMWISKYALSDGIRKAEGKASDSGYFYENDAYYQGYKVGRDAHETEAAARAAAETMRVKKIDSLKKQIKKLEKLQFTA